MLKLLKFLMTGSFHEHKWEIIETVTHGMALSSTCKKEDSDYYRVWSYTCRCSSCGKIEKVYS